MSAFIMVDNAADKTLKEYETKNYEGDGLCEPLELKHPARSVKKRISLGD